jgi:hypothetical protein
MYSQQTQILVKQQIFVVDLVTTKITNYSNKNHKILLQKNIFLQHFEKHCKTSRKSEKTNRLVANGQKTLQYLASPFTTKLIHILYKFIILM